MPLPQDSGARPFQAAAPEAGPAPAGSAEGRGSRLAGIAPAIPGAPAPVPGGGLGPRPSEPRRGARLPAKWGDRPGSVVRKRDQAQGRCACSTEAPAGAARFAGSLAPRGAKTGAN